MTKEYNDATDLS